MADLMAGCCIGSEQQHAVWEACPQDAEPSELGAKCAAVIKPELFEPAIKKVADELYCTLMESVQDWLCDNVEQNIASRIGNAERWARELRKELYDLDQALGIGDRFIPRAQRVADLLRAERERDQLLYAVACKHDGETRFQTALRHLHERENAQGMSAGTAETLQAAQGDSPPARSRSDAPNHDILKGDAGQPNKRGATSHDRDNNASGKGIE